jgi:MFS family permease
MPPAGTTSDWKFAIRALRSRNYRLFFGGQSVSLIGTWMTRIATSWLVYRLTGSALLLGIVGFAGQIPAFVLGPIAGVWVDRWDRRRTLVVTQILSMAQSLALAALALPGIITIHEVIWLSLFQGLINAVDMPARQAFVVEMIERRADLGNAIALNSSMVNAARLIGPAIAGVVVAALGEGYCFLIDGISYIGVIVSLLLMSARPAGTVRKRTTAWRDLAEGWRYVSRSKPIRSLLLLMTLISLVGQPYSVLMPVFASKVLHGSSYTLGFLVAASGVGALAGAVTLAMRHTVVGLGKVIFVSAILFGAGLIGFGLSAWLWLSLSLMLVTGFGMMRHMAATNTILQAIVEEDKRGRAMAFYSMAFMGMAPFGSLLAGTLAARIGAPNTLILGGAGCVVGGLWFAAQLPAIRAIVRPIYIELGILPELAEGVQAASALQTPPQA